MSTTGNLLVEIGTEEIPARMLDRGASDLQSLIQEALVAQGLPPVEGRFFHSPRRLAVYLTGIPVRQEDREEVVYGPGVKIAFDENGELTKAAIGFAKGQGVDPSQLMRLNGPKGEVVGIITKVTGRQTVDVLKEILPAAIEKLTFPKAMRWASGTGPFARPVHWLVALFNNDVIPFTFCGIESDRLTRGHRFLAPDVVAVPSADQWEQILATHHVMVRPEQRRAAIDQALVDAAKKLGCTFIAEEALKSEVANLVEEPHFVIGSFDPDFLKLPREVLISAMASHQRYFAMEDQEGHLLPKFGVVSNNLATDMNVVVQGYERVLAARLYDARFFWDQDLKTGIEEMAKRLPQRLFLKGAGDMAEKTARVTALVKSLAEHAGLDETIKADAIRAAQLCKADLMSHLVGEFPELQGQMGMYFARAAGESEAVALAIAEHYLPRFAQDSLPTSHPGALLALADRIDSIVACFRVGAIPTGSKDPLGLRRQAIGVLKLLANQGYKRITLKQLFDIAEVDAKLQSELEGFFRDRFHGILSQEHGVPADFANALLDIQGQGRPADVITMALALRDFAQKTEGFTDFLDNVFKRVANILKQADEKVAGWRQTALEQGLLEADLDQKFVTEVEKELDATRKQALAAFNAAVESGDYEALLTALYSFRDPLARFFGSGRDGVPVLIEADEQKRLMRLALLHHVFVLFNWYADFTKISTR